MTIEVTTDPPKGDKCGSMYCPKCATSNADDAKFCRACGANLALVPQALTGELPSRATSPHSWSASSSLQGGISRLFLGLGFLAIAFLLGRSRVTWAVWLLIPAFLMAGKGLAQILGSRLDRRSVQSPIEARPSMPTSQLESSGVPELTPPSVTESTTRHLDQNAGSRDTR